jgi:hypothetical protein
MKKTIFAGLALVALIQPAAAQEPATTYIHAGRLLADPASGRVETNKTIVVTAGKVAEIRDGFVGEGKVVDLRDQFVMPGFIDSHVHLTFESSPTSRLDAVTKSTVDQAFDGVVFAKRTVRAGFTTVVDLGSDPQAINALRDATATGKVVGPRIIAAGGVAAHGGHGDIHGYRQEIIDLFRAPTLCSGADDCARAVRLGGATGRRRHQDRLDRWRDVEHRGGARPADERRRTRRDRRHRASPRPQGRGARARHRRRQRRAACRGRFGRAWHLSRRRIDPPVQSEGQLPRSHPARRATPSRGRPKPPTGCPRRFAPRRAPSAR